MTELQATYETAVTVGGDADQWERAAAAWLASQKSDHTRRTYLAAWRQFLDFAGIAPKDITADHVIAWRAELVKRDYSQSTINVKLSALSSFFDFVQRRGLVRVNPAVDPAVKRESVTPYGKATFLDTDAGDDLRLVASIDTGEMKGKRDRAIILLLLTRALRVGSVSRLRVGDLRRVGGRSFLTVTLKGGATEELEISEETAAAILDYLELRPDADPPDPMFIATAAGREAAALLGHETGALTPQGIRAMLKARCNAVFGRGHRITPHSLRHTAAARASKDGASVAAVANLLRHKNRATTLIYLDGLSGREEAREVVDRLGGRYKGL